jgi:hypothetical protein
VVLRVWMPDRPGALGQVASRIGAVRGDVLGIEILEQGEGQVVDELIVSLPSASLAPLLTAEVGAVDGVSVESVREVDQGRADPSLTALSAGALIAEAHPADRVTVLCHAVRDVVEADWVVVIRGERIIDRVGDPPDPGWLVAFGAGSEHLDSSGAGPTDVAWAHLGAARMAIAAGRADRPIHERERVRITLLARLADALV